MKPFDVIDAPQRSPEWFLARCGRLTGSVADAILTRIKTGESAARRDLRLQLVCERLTGIPQDEGGFVNAAMQWGIDHEAEALAAYEAATGELAQTSGFLAHRDHLAGCSLDGHLGDYDAILELKCPKSATHLRYLREGVIPRDYLPQIRHNLWVTGADWCDFVSFDPRFPPGLRLFRKRILRDQADLAAYQVEALTFLTEVAFETAAVTALAVEVA